MPERASLNQTIQIGVEAVPGTSVAATRKLRSISFEPTPEVDVDQFRPVGDKFRSITTLGREWVTAALTGRGNYNEIIYALSSVLTTAVITTPDAVGAPSARKWVFTPSNSADDSPKTYTIEHGSSVRADKITYGLITEFSMAFSRDTVEHGGSLIGRAIQDNITLTANPTSVALQPIQPTEISVYLDTTSAGLGTTKLTRVLSGDFSIGGRYGPVFVVDAANPGFVAHVETEPDLTLNLMLEADAAGMALLTQLRDGSTRFVRVRAVGPLIGGTTAYDLTIDMAVKIADTGGFSDQDGVYAIEWNFVGVYDSTWGKTVEVSVTNVVAAL